MVSRLPQEFSKFSGSCSLLKRMLRETKRSLDDITAAKIFTEGDDISSMINSLPTLQNLDGINGRPALVIFGQSCSLKAKLANSLLNQVILPVSGGSWRWVRIVYGRASRISLMLNSEFELVNKLSAHQNAWTVIPEEDLKEPYRDKNVSETITVLDVELCNPLLIGANFHLLIPPDCDEFNTPYLGNLLKKGLEDVNSIFIYAVNGETLSKQNLHELDVLKKLFPKQPVFFICLVDTEEPSSELTESEQHQLEERDGLPNTDPQLNVIDLDPKYQPLRKQLTCLGYLQDGGSRLCIGDQFYVGSQFHIGRVKLDRLLGFVQVCLQLKLIQASTSLHEILSQFVRKFILSAFDMAREIQITPRRIQYVQEKEGELYKSLMQIANEKQEEITQLIQVTLHDMKDGLVEKAAEHQANGEGTEESESCQGVRVATTEIQNLVLSRLSNAVLSQLVKSVNCLQDTFVGTLQRCLESLERNCLVQETRSLASDAVKQSLSAAYNVELTSSATSSLLHSFMERLRLLVQAFQLPWSAPPRLDASWRKRVATEMLDSLSATRLGRTISAQFRDRVRESHEAFQNALRLLEMHHSGRLEETEEQRVAIRKYHAPRLARLVLESTSMCDKVRYGMPQLGKEIGRGQYGVVFACDSWGPSPGPCAIKTVMPPDDKHWNDLAMEFYYTRTIPEHQRIVRLQGSVVNYSYGGDCSPAVYLVMDRLTRDLYQGLRTGLKWLVRLQIAIDVVEGIRYLHSQGLVHRDIKLKNVLLDNENRAKLTDLGFCIPEAMMSGSIVGTPVHMAPELLSGHYDSSVDVYAFGILFWYICANHVKLPLIFEKFHNKEQLWTSVKRGTRPERLPQFDDKCWMLMVECWSGNPNKRPLLGDVLPLLESIQTQYSLNDHAPTS